VRGRRAPRRIVELADDLRHRDLHYARPVASLGSVLLEHTRNFFTNWSRSDLPFAAKVAVTVKNRAKSLVNKGCCDHHGEPGC
jgi:hypothetical protein